MSILNLLRSLSFSLCIILCLLSVDVAASPVAKNVYDIQLKVKGVADTTCYIAYHYGHKVFVQDTLEVDGKGVVRMAGPEHLPGGIYVAIFPGKKFFEFLYSGKEDRFKIEVDDVKNAVNSMSVSGSKENALFNAYQRKLGELTKERKAAVKQLTALEKEGNGEGDLAKELKEKISANDKETAAFRLAEMDKHEGTFYAKILKTMSEPIVPDDLKEDPQKSYYYFKSHFWDDVDFEDERLVRTPILYNKLNTYLENLTPKNPDSINVACDLFIDKSRANPDLFKYAVVTLTHKYETSKLMGMDAVFVHLADKYYVGGEAEWADSATLAKVTQRVLRMKPNLLGKKAPRLILEGLDGEKIDLYKMDKDYTVVFFYSYSCGHCKKTMPKYVDFYERHKDKSLDFLAITTKIEKDKWIDYIEEKDLPFLHAWDPTNRSNFRALYDVHSTPTVYLLDKDKKIIAKRVDVASLEKIMLAYMNDESVGPVKESEDAVEED